METVARRKIDRNTNYPTYSTAYFSWKGVEGGARRPLGDPARAGDAVVIQVWRQESRHARA
jgi:hypothetical protein